VKAHLSVPMLIAISAVMWGGSAHAQEAGLSAQVREQLEAVLARQKAKIEKESTDCADKLDMPIVANTSEELRARYDLDKAKAFNACMIDESGVFWPLGRALLERKSDRR